ncbi:uncharacterized protein THITE_2111221 [Thermothielavioides terrestris NRRL 8126]|uniref:RAVE subunit 2/Rogdi n=1 Tax=Thermothielavioides terrestris (strain ATCC 38088 / NRRL 8126) TaxID=578455 RepID=G2R1D2_THETT|nr:uncharacterized protein THITE_2111221 [Thermothielavioides terrestris NRRL 8126]AEO64867.1 hypothetical protein THITE_2111221 [Thermothielavioides terrestris NRRL 8126]
MDASWVLIGSSPAPPEQKRELDWLIEELHETLTNVRHGLEDCYALLAPVDPGSTLVLSTPRNEIVKGHITRVGTRIVKGTIHLRLRTLPHQTLTINPDHPIHLAPLTALHALLTHSIDLLNLTFSYAYPDSDAPATPSSLLGSLPPPQFLSAQLRLLSQTLAEASSLLKGAPLPTADPTWTTRSAAPSHFLPPLAHPTPSSSNPSLSFHLSIQDSCLVLWLRTLEPASAPVNFGTKLALAIGTARRLEHDETEKVFGYCCDGDDGGDDHHTTTSTASGSVTAQPGPAHSPGPAPSLFPPAQAPALAPTIPLSGTRDSNNKNNKNTSSSRKNIIEVFVREKVRVETADPSLLSLSAKLTALGHTLAVARRNLAAVMGEEWGEPGEDGEQPMD